MVVASRLVRRGFLGIFACSLLAAAWPAPASAQQPSKPAAERSQPRKPRLPPYYAQVAKEDQRAALDKIQASYAAKLEQLQAELDKLRAQRDAELRAALGPEQQKQLDELLVAARDRRRARSALRGSAAAGNAATAEAAAPRASRPAQERAGVKP
jgi:hypothetical protein